MKTYHTRCNWAGTLCEEHGLTVRAESPKAAFEKVLDAIDGDVHHFGPLHRESAESNRFIAFVNIAANERVQWDTMHGAIEVIPGRPRS